MIYHTTFNIRDEYGVLLSIRTIAPFGWIDLLIIYSVLRTIPRDLHAWLDKSFGMRCPNCQKQASSIKINLERALVE